MNRIMAAMDVDSGSALGELRMTHLDVCTIFCVRFTGKHARDNEDGTALKKMHVDTNAVTRKGVEDDFDSLLRFYYGRNGIFSSSAT